MIKVQYDTKKTNKRTLTSFDHEGIENILDHFIIFFLNNAYMNITDDTNSDINVAIAAPDTPILKLNISIGSSMAFMTFANKLMYSGVTVSSIPEKRKLKPND